MVKATMHSYCLDKETKTSVFRVIPKSEYIPCERQGYDLQLSLKKDTWVSKLLRVWQEAKAFLKEVA